MPPPHATGAPAPLRPVRARCPRSADTRPVGASRERRSEEHTSELQSRLHLVCRLLLEKKKNLTSVSGGVVSYGSLTLWRARIVAGREANQHSRCSLSHATTVGIQMLLASLLRILPDII